MNRTTLFLAATCGSHGNTILNNNVSGYKLKRRGKDALLPMAEDILVHLLGKPKAGL